MRILARAPGWRSVAIGALAFVTAATVGASPPAPEAEGKVAGDNGPIFEVAYEAPFAANRGYHRDGYIADPDSDVLFRIWNDGGERSDFLSGHFRAGTRDCGDGRVHFCIASAYLSFVAPLHNAKGDWSWQIDDDIFSVESRQKTQFRGKRIDTITIRRVGATFKADATYFVYNYDLGLVSFSTFGAEAISPAERRMPSILEGAMILESESGLGGRAYCKYWKCGAGK